MRSDDAYTPDGEGGKRPDRSVIVYAQRAREAFKDVPIVIGGIEASLRRIAHFDYWSEKVRRSILLDAKADLLVYGNGERQICEIAHRLAAGESIATSPTCAARHSCARARPKVGSRSTRRISTRRGRLNPPVDPYAMEPERYGRPMTGAESLAPQSESAAGRMPTHAPAGARSRHPAGKSSASCAA